MKAYQAKERIKIPHLLIHACQNKGKQSQYTLLPKSIVGKLLNTKKKRSFDDILEESFNGIIKKNNSKQNNIDHKRVNYSKRNYPPNICYNQK